MMPGTLIWFNFNKCIVYHLSAVIFSPQIKLLLTKNLQFVIRERESGSARTKPCGSGGLKKFGLALIWRPHLFRRFICRKLRKIAFAGGVNK
jgi:hypothetical protein